DLGIGLFDESILLPEFDVHLRDRQFGQDLILADSVADIEVDLPDVTSDLRVYGRLLERLNGVAGLPDGVPHGAPLGLDYRHRRRLSLCRGSRRLWRRLTAAARGGEHQASGRHQTGQDDSPLDRTKSDLRNVRSHD